MNAITKIENVFLTVDQVAMRYGVSTDSIWRWKRQGRFPGPVRIGPNCTRWRLSDLLAHEANLQACFVTHYAFSAAV